MSVEFVVTLLIAAATSAFLAWSIGAGGTGSTPFAPAVGAGALPTMRAAFLVGIFAVFGAILQGARITTTVGTDLIWDISLSAPDVILVLFVAAGLMTLGISTGYPIATAFTVTGGIIGTGLGVGGTPAWEVYTEIGLMWVFGPIVAAGLAFALAFNLARESVSDRRSIPMLIALVSIVLVNVELVIPMVGPQSVVGLATGDPVTRGVLSVIVGTCVAYVTYRWLDRSVTAGVNRLLLLMGAVVAFSAGGSQVGIAVGPLVPLVEPTGFPIIVLIVGGSLGLLIGSWTAAPRMIKAVALDYAQLGPRRALSALTAAFVLTQVAVNLGIPISFNQIMISAIFGSGYAVRGHTGTSQRKLGLTAGAWFLSFWAAFGIGFVAAVAY